MPTTSQLENSSILILGLGREGMSTLAYLRKLFPDKLLGLADKRAWTELELTTQQAIESDNRTQLFFGDTYLKHIAEYEFIFKSPGVNPSLPELVDAKAHGTKITSNAQLFFESCPGITIGVTGTKGKSTTTSLIYEVLKAGGVDARLTGNIGIPPLSSLENTTASTVFVAELSSYQLMAVRKSPHIAVIQNIVPEHTDYHGSFAAYVNAKQTIVRYQTENDYTVFNASYPISADIANGSKAQKIPFGYNIVEEVGCFLEDDTLIYCSAGRREKIIPIHAIPLKGPFNLQNVMPSIIVGRHFGVGTETIAAAIEGFKSLEHRLEYVGTCSGVDFYNDSLSTIPEATIAAIHAFPNQNVILLAGGFDRGQVFTDLAQAVLGGSVKAVILFPTTGERLWDDILRHAKQSALPEYAFVTDMNDAVQRAYGLAEAGDVVLLSPAGASFGRFRDYRDRGEQFGVAVKQLLHA